MPYENKLTQQDLWTLRALIQKDGWGQFMRELGSLMAEQADKVEPNSEQDVNLFNCSNTIHAMDEFFEKCGTFDYLSHPFFPEEFREEFKSILDRK